MNYNGLIKFDTGNCHGISTTLFVSGCSNRCKGCHNPQTWDCDYGVAFDDNAKTEFFDAISNPHISHVVFSGGDPFFPKNRETIFTLCSDIKNIFPEKEIIIYSGYTIETLLKEGVSNTLKLINFLIDGPYIQNFRTDGRDLRGSYNQRCFLVQAGANKEFKLIDWSLQYFRDTTTTDQANFGKKIIVNSSLY